MWDRTIWWDCCYGSAVPDPPPAKAARPSASSPPATTAQPQRQYGKHRPEDEAITAVTRASLRLPDAFHATPRRMICMPLPTSAATYPNLRPCSALWNTVAFPEESAAEVARWLA